MADKKLIFLLRELAEKRNPSSQSEFLKKVTNKSLLNSVRDKAEGQIDLGFHRLAGENQPKLPEIPVPGLDRETREISKTLPIEREAKVRSAEPPRDAPENPYEDDIMGEYNRLREGEEEGKRAELIGRAGDTINQALAGVDQKPAEGFWKAQREGRRGPIEDFIKLQKLRSSGKKKETTLASPLMRKFAKDRFGIDIPEGATMEDLKGLAPYAGMSVQTRKLEEYQKPRVGEMARHQRRMGVKDQWQRQQKDEPGVQATKDIANIDRSIMLLKKIQKDKPEINTGPVMNLIAIGRKAIGQDDPKTTAFMSRIGRELAEELHRISGTAVADPEFIRQRAQRLTMSLQDGTFDQVLADILETYEEEKSIKLESLRASGLDPRGHARENVGLQPEEPYEVPVGTDIADAMYGPRDESGRPLSVPIGQKGPKSGLSRLEQLKAEKARRLRLRSTPGGSR